MKATIENLHRHASKPMTQWLIDQARSGETLTYAEAKSRLEAEHDLDGIFSAMMGRPADYLMHLIHQKYPEAPLLNVLLVRGTDGLPGGGAGEFMAKRLRQPKLAKDNARNRFPNAWRMASEKTASEVYTYDHWDQVFEEVFGKRLAEPKSAKPAEKDGLRIGRGGEGPNHKVLRLWVKNNPSKIARRFASYRSETEVELSSADRVDVVYFGADETVVVEVKSKDSNEADILRGVFQCIKYRAIKAAMDLRSGIPVIRYLVTQTIPPNRIKSLMQRHDIRHFLAPKEIS